MFKKQGDPSRWVAVDKGENEEVKPFSPQWLALQFLVDWTPEDIEMAIDRDVEINLRPFISVVENIVIQEILKWFKDKRPDIYEVLSTNKGTNWLRKNICKIMEGG